jgi:DNA (cytosine-5)-methyltransferase 1
VTHTLKGEGFDASEDGTGRGQPIVAIDIRNAAVDPEGPTMALQAGGMGDGRGLCINAIPHTLTQMGVRRLMPVECERLQGFPDNWTLVPTGKNGKPAADGPRYKQCGNSMATTVMRWIGSRIAAALAPVEDEFEALLGPAIDESEALLS